MDKALGLLGLARKGSRIELGEEAAGGACRSSKARLLLLASDAGESVKHRAEYFVRSGKPPLLIAPYTKAELGSALGRPVCPIAALTDVSLALAFVKALPEPESYEDLLNTLEPAVKRVQQRRKEEKAHRANVRRGNTHSAAR
ncbi:MAG: 50S ribosomal protein L7 [Oscillospiraceae bacterium]|nr:50S ribosomal protein L7 [Oscillospiraceae bacterium]